MNVRLMSPFPFTVEDWELVCEATRRVVNATLADDDALRASYFVELQDLLLSLRDRYGEHPVLLETEADFSDDIGEQVELYERAKRLALTRELPTLSIRLALAKVLLTDLRQPTRARQELENCQQELAQDGNADERTAWRELMVECNAADNWRSLIQRTENDTASKHVDGNQSL